MEQVLEGSHAVAEAVRLAKVQVVSAFPITPQTHIVEYISRHCASGKLKAKFLRVESEHSALAAIIGASLAGARTFTSTSSQGLALMHEMLHWASGARLPIVMANVNRALAPAWNVWTDQTDSLSQRDTGWLQFYCEDCQEVFDTTLMSFRMAESVNLPVMIVLDAFYLSHTYEPVDIPNQKKADCFLPEYVPKFQMDVSQPCTFNQLAPPDIYMEMRYNMQTAMDYALDHIDIIQKDFEKIFGRRYDRVEQEFCDDADTIIVASGTVASTCRQVIRDLRSKGEKAGLLKIRMFRPFPVDVIRKIVGSAKKLAVLDRNFSFGATGIFAQEIRASLCNMPQRPAVFGYITGLGGRDITPDTITDIYYQTKKSKVLDQENQWVQLREVDHDIESC